MLPKAQGQCRFDSRPYGKCIPKITYVACRTASAIIRKFPVRYNATKYKSDKQTGLVLLDYEDLLLGNVEESQIKEAFGSDGLGIILVSNVPGFAPKRERLLHLAHRFASLPEDVKAKHVDELSHYSVGWSHGKELLASGQPDRHKGSYYANPLVHDQLRPSPGDAPLDPHHSTPLQQAATGGFLNDAEIDRLRAAFPGYYRPNLWPKEELPAFEEAFTALGQLVCAVGLLLLQQCDRYVSGQLGTVPGQLSGVLQRSRNPKARLLHYFPPSDCNTDTGGGDGGSQHEEPWCGWHSDHGSLTGLTAAMYLDADGREVPCPDPQAGLNIRDRQQNVVRAVIPPHCLAFQVGEALQVHSGGLLQATPHYVRAAHGAAAAGISRNTFAVFMQPNVEEIMDCPPGVDPASVAIGQWRAGLTFGEFSEATFEHYYSTGQAHP